jgi:hypothetical protein
MCIRRVLVMNIDYIKPARVLFKNHRTRAKYFKLPPGLASTTKLAAKEPIFKNEPSTRNVNFTHPALYCHVLLNDHSAFHDYETRHCNVH